MTRRNLVIAIQISSGGYSQQFSEVGTKLGHGNALSERPPIGKEHDCAALRISLVYETKNFCASERN